jgi:hypothetical protein
LCWKEIGLRRKTYLAGSRILLPLGFVIGERPGLATERGDSRSFVTRV